MGQVPGFKGLIAWQKAMDLAVAVYCVTKPFPVEERFGLTGQVRRAAVKIPSNIAEGYGRRTKRDYLRFLDIARGSANEVETQLTLALRLGYGRKEDLEAVLTLTREEQRILTGLVDSLERSEKTAARP